MSENKFLHEEIYRGEDFLDKLQPHLIVICGVGTLGSNLADTLARQGVRKMRLIDMDRVEDHNINTQIYGEGDIGSLKVAAAQNRLFQDVGVEAEGFMKELTEKTIKKALLGATLVIDTFDNTEARQLVYDYCSKNGLPCLHAGTFADYSEVVWNEEYLVPEDAEAGEDACEYPLARNLAMFTCAIAAEEIIDFCTAGIPRMGNWSFTLKDMQVRPYK